MKNIIIDLKEKNEPIMQLETGVVPPSYYGPSHASHIL